MKKLTRDKAAIKVRLQEYCSDRIHSGKHCRDCGLVNSGICFSDLPWVSDRYGVKRLRAEIREAGIEIG